MKRFFTFIFFALFSLTVLHAQKVAVVLSGGGAYGAAHIGFLRVLEENNIPIDYIAGTSAGAIIGGLYAAGYTIDEIEQLFLTGVVQRLSTGKIEQNEVFTFAGDNPTPKFLSLRFNVRENHIKPLLPNYLRAPSKMDLKFTELMAPASAAANYLFDSLYIPFRCVAADIDSAMVYVFRKGLLSNAVRSSMSMPIFFKPVEVDNKLLYDGGMYNNFPADVAMEDWQPDIILGCKVANNYEKPDPDDLVSQIKKVLMRNSDYSVDSTIGIVVEPHLNKANVLNFKDVQHYIDSGFTATYRSIDDIKAKVARRTTMEERTAKRTAFTQKIPDFGIDTITFTGINSRQEQFIRKQLKNNYEDNAEKEFYQDYIRLLQFPHVRSIYPQLFYDHETQKWNLNLDVKLAPQFDIELGGAITTTNASNIFLQFNLLSLRENGYRWYINAYGGLFYRSISTNFETIIPGEVPVALDVDLTSNFLRYRERKGIIDIGDIPLTNSQNIVGLTFKASLPIKNTMLLRFGAGAGIENSQYNPYGLTFDEEKNINNDHFKYVTPMVQFELNTLNKPQFAYEGTRLRLKCLYLLAQDNFKSYFNDSLMTEGAFSKNWLEFKLNFEHYFRVSQHFRIGLSLDGIVSNEPLFQDYISTLIQTSPFQPTILDATNFVPQLRAPIYAAPGVSFIFPLLKDNLNIRLASYLFQPYQKILQKDDNTPELSKTFPTPEFLIGGTIAYHTFFGPLSLNLHYHHNDKDPLTFFVTFGYILFNKTVRDL